MYQPMLTRTIARGMSSVTHEVTLDEMGVLSGEVWTSAAGKPVSRFLGVPYARPPVGPLRWRAPQPPLAWEGVRSNPARLPMCPQPDSGLLTGKYQGRRVEETEEDMLVLNVFAPAPSASKRAKGGAAARPAASGQGGCPVIVYIHGGAGKFGTAHTDETAGDALASRGVVYVSINYRLGVFGFLAHPALSHEDDDASEAAASANAEAAASRGGSGASSSRVFGGNPLPPRACGNYAILDQIMALQWVREHIGRFGGDPSNVTIWGLSSGSQFVSTLLVTPAAAGLFHRAVVQSCCDLANMRKLTSSSDVWEGKSAEEWGVAYGKAIGCKLRTAPPPPPPVGRGVKRAASPVWPQPVAPPSPPSHFADEDEARDDECGECDDEDDDDDEEEEDVDDGTFADVVCPHERAARKQLAAMRDVPAKMLVNTSLLKASTDCYESAADDTREGALKPKASLLALESGAFHRVPVMMGYTADDGLGSSELEQIGFDESIIRNVDHLFELMRREFGDAACEALRRYTAGLPDSGPGSGRKRLRAALDGLSRDVWYNAATWHMADAIARAAEPPPVYVYQFTQKVHQCAEPCTPKSAWHGCDTTFWNGEEPIRPACCAEHNHPRPSQSHLGQTMFEYLLNFARSGSPNGDEPSDELPYWQAHSTRRPTRHMELGNTIGMVELPTADVERHAFCSREFFGKRLRAEIRRGEEQAKKRVRRE